MSKRIVWFCVLILREATELIRVAPMSATQRIRVVIADDQELVRAGFTMVINSQTDMQVVGQAANGTEAIALVQATQPDIVLMDIRMPGLDGIAATAHITAQAAHNSEHHTRVIILTTFDLDEYVMAAINAGASGFLLKDTEPETLLRSIRTVDQGNAIIAPTATKRLIENMVKSGMTAPAQQETAQETYVDPELALLTDREREVLVLIARGMSNQEIADELFISLPTVKTHVAHILDKIHARDRVQAVVFAYENHLVS